MIPVTDIVSLLKAFCHLHNVANQEMHPAYAGTVAAMLGECEVRIFEMEFRTPASRAVHPVPSPDDNVIYPNFTRPAPPPSDGGDAA